MSYEHYIGVIDDESVLVECGPMRLVIRAWDQNRPQLKLAKQAGEVSILYLERIARRRLLLSRPWRQISELPKDGLARRMVASVQAIGDDDLTPMAAVAGTIADAVANWLFQRDTTKVIVDNGGDIAIRLAPGEKATVGIRPRVTSPIISHLINLDGGSSWGVATSGMGGRSFTRGIASAVTILASSAALADAAATAVANACIADDNGIIQQPAGDIDPNSDLADAMVTTEIGSLNRDTVKLAIDAARRKTARLSQNEAIVGAFVAQGDAIVITKGLQPYVSAVKGDAD